MEKTLLLYCQIGNISQHLAWSSQLMATLVDICQHWPSLDPANKPMLANYGCLCTIGVGRDTTTAKDSYNKAHLTDEIFIISNNPL